jgi:acetyl-CoA/propionyl-CoA carboxylase biotin carboxyl carrier protein
VRVDSGVYAGYAVPGSFDSLLAKLIAWGRDRDEALARARRALAEFQIEGVATVLPFARYVVTDPAFTAAAGPFGVHTRWIEEECTAEFEPAAAVAAPAAPRLTRMPLEIDGRLVEIGLPEGLLSRLAGGSAGGGHADWAGAGALADGNEAARNSGAGEQASAIPNPNVLLAPFTGTLTAWKIEAGTLVTEGDTVAVIEAMKMEVPVKAARSGTLQQSIEAGRGVLAGAEIGSITE